MSARLLGALASDLLFLVFGMKKEATMVHFVTELRRVRRSPRQDRLGWGLATFLAVIAVLLIVSELIGKV